MHDDLAEPGRQGPAGAARASRPEPVVGGLQRPRAGLPDRTAYRQNLTLREAEVLHYLLGPRRAVVPEHWAIVPTRTPNRRPGLLHWADPVTPWQPELTPERESWRAYHEGVWAEPEASRADLYLVDGRFRVACFMQTLLHASPDALVAIHDFAKRPQYHVVQEVARERHRRAGWGRGP